MIHRYLAVLCLWALLGAFVCQYEEPPSETTPSVAEQDDRVSRRDLARIMQQQKAVRLVYSEATSSVGQRTRELVEKLTKAFPEGWDIEVLPEQDIQPDDLQDLALIILGRQFQNPALIQFLGQLPFQQADDHFRFYHKNYAGEDLSYRLFLYPNPQSRTPVFLIGGNSDAAIRKQLALSEGDNWGNIFWRSWGYEIYKDQEVIVRGNLKDRDWTFAPDNHFDFSEKEVLNFDSEHFHFHDLAGLGQAFVEQLATACEEQVQRVYTFTGSNRSLAPIHYYIYPSIEEKGLRLMNTETGHLVQENREVHVVINDTFRGQYTHQDIQLILHDLLGDAARAFLDRGLACHFNSAWEEKGALYWAARLYRSGNLPNLSELIDDELFQRESPLVMTAAAGSLASYLIDQWGDQLFLERYRQWPQLDPAEVSALEKGWHDFLKRIPISENQTQPSPLPYFRGFNFAHEGYQIYNGYGSDLARTSLEKLSQLGTNAVAIVPYGFQRDPQKPGFLGVHHGAGGENDESVIFAHAQAQALGMYTLLKPQLWVSDSWPGAVDMKTEEDWTQFFDYYHRWIRHYALLAEMRGFDAFCLGVEFSKATLQKPDAWRKILTRIRGLYSGPITYAANWGEEFEQLTFWPELDFIGLNCYYPLSKKDKPSKTELKRNFAEVLEKAEKVSKKYGKPLVFTEVGFRSVANSWKNPHAEVDGRPYDPECQRVCYEVLFEGIAGKPWIKGLFIWKWPSYLDHNEENPVGFTPNGKPAERVVRQWFSEKLGD